MNERGIRDVIADKSEFMLSLCDQLLGNALNQKHHSIIDRCIRELYMQAWKVKKVPVMTDFYHILKSQKEMEAQELALSLELFVEGSLNIFNHQTNVVFDRRTRKALCVLDLDTVMPGSSLYDYGDSIRFGAATAAEDEKDLSKMGINLHLFQVYTAGYLAACKSLTPKELELLPLGAKIITLELAVRFLTDYLDGDRYFRVAYPEHNLVRARAQMKLVADMEAHWDEMQAIVAEEAAKRN